MSVENIQTPRKALNKAYLKIKPCRDEIELFKRELQKLISSLRPDESEEFNKNHISAFLREAHYKGEYFMNTKNRNDANKDLDHIPRSSIKLLGNSQVNVLLKGISKCQNRT